MRIAAISDVHGNLDALSAVLADIRRRGCDLVVNLGDILSGPLQPAETADLLMSLDLTTIRGNHERQLLETPPERMGESDAHAYAELQATHLDWLARLPATRALDDEVFLCHGTPRDDLEYFLETVEPDGLRAATEVAILNANYVAARLADAYDIHFSGNVAGIKGGGVAHECILDLRPLKETSGVTAEDVAKRLIDYGFHAPTLSFPVAGTLMVEPTESESLAELDRFVDAMLAIRAEIAKVESGAWPRDDNPLKAAPFTAEALAKADWPHPYTREEAAFPLAALRRQKYWSPVGRIDNVYGDRNLSCSCVPVADYAA